MALALVSMSVPTLAIGQSSNSATTDAAVADLIVPLFVEACVENAPRFRRAGGVFIDHAMIAVSEGQWISPDRSIIAEQVNDPEQRSCTVASAGQDPKAFELRLLRELDKEHKGDWDLRSNGQLQVISMNMNSARLHMIAHSPRPNLVSLTALTKKD
ncbi:MAG: hypothetical protein KDJ77_15945 [Rhodobiaceae bacterium]|nr:hypothetical protein [Rhodobiaceae bacterium]